MLMKNMRWQEWRGHHKLGGSTGWTFSPAADTPPHPEQTRESVPPGALSIEPCTVKAARKRVAEWHRHLKDIQGGLFAAQCVTSTGECVGVAIAGNPSRVWQHEAKLVISRVATTGHENACSALYGALCRAAKALGYREVWTYTLPEEPGTSLRAAGFIDKGMTTGGEYDRPSRSRKPAKRSEPKRRWLRVLRSAPPPHHAGRSEEMVQATSGVRSSTSRSPGE